MMKTLDFLEQIANFSPEKRARLVSQLSPLSSQQQRMWFLNQLEPDSPAYTFIATRLTGRLNITALEKSLKEIVQRHQILRTIFVTLENQSFQIVLREMANTQLSYWKQQLDNASYSLELPTDRPRPLLQTFRGALKSFILSASLSKSIKTLSQQQGVTPFIILLTAFKVLLYRYTGQDEIRVGTPIACRNQVEIEELIGFFSNVLVLRTDLSGNPTFQRLLTRVKDMCLEGYAHQDLPFEHLVESLQPPRDLSRTPLFQVMCVLQNVPMPTMQLPELTLAPQLIDSGTAKFDLSLDFAENAKGIYEGLLEFRPLTALTSTKSCRY